MTAALANPARRFHRYLAAADDAPQGPIAAERADRAAIAAILGDAATHQGLALLADPLAPAALEDALLADGPLVFLDQATDPQNVGAVLRSACAFGAAGVVLTDRGAPPESGALAKAASGALEITPVIRVVNLARAMDEAKAAGRWVLGLDGATDTLLAEAKPDAPIALVLGAEGAGLRRLTRERCDLLARLPIRPEMESLNLSNAAAIALYELAR